MRFLSLGIALAALAAPGAPLVAGSLSATVHVSATLVNACSGLRATDGRFEAAQRGAGKWTQPTLTINCDTGVPYSIARSSGPAITGVGTSRETRHLTPGHSGEPAPLRTLIRRTDLPGVVTLMVVY